jgi:hypothetical protein
MNLAAKILFIAVTLGSFALFSRTVLLDSGEKAIIRGYLRGAGVPVVGTVE